MFSERSIQALDSLDRELFEMIDLERSRERVDRHRRLLMGLAVGAGFLSVLSVVGLGVLAWGWLATIFALWTTSTVVLIAIIASEERVARRTAERAAEDR